MVLKLYNTLTRRKEVFKPIKKTEVGFYGCGPTVYSYQHIGNIYRYIFEDVLYRVLKYNGYNVKHIINVTDVGHLTSDADEGEDKVEKAASKEGKKAEEITKHYFKQFKRDLEKLNILPPDKWVWATKHIKEQIELIKKLEKKGYTYKTSDGIYFDTSKVKDYGKLGNLNVGGLEAGKRVNLGEKKNKTDFALWKFSKEPGKRQQEWDSPWGIGFPGWHIECSAMSSKYLGRQFDIHTGGEEHIQVHHTNEIAQSESAFGKKPGVKYWMHLRWLLVNGGKMSKSAGNIYTLDDLEKKGFDPLEFRYLFLSGSYRKPLNFTWKNLETAKNSYRRLKRIIQELDDEERVSDVYLKEFEAAINDDLNLPEALQVLWKMLRDKNPKKEDKGKKAMTKKEIIKKMDEVLGLKLLEKEEIKIPKEIQELVKEREKARKEKNWAKADKLRDEIKKLGFIVEDVGGESRVKKAE